jgi:hypothetical protein
MATNKGVLDWTVEKNDEGHRTYNVLEGLQIVVQ